MYVLVDLDALVFRHKHPNHSVLSSLAHIECSSCGISIFPIDTIRGALRSRLTDAQLRTLLKNTTGVSPSIFTTADKIFGQLQEAAEALEFSDVIGAEVHRQAALISSDDEDNYKYVKGSNKAQKLPDVYLPAPLMCSPGDGARIAPTAPPQPPANTSTAVIPAAAVRAGTVTATIWALADSMWEAAGKPTDLKIVLKLRQQMYDLLEAEHNIKRSTASNTLAGWQKSRLPS